MHTFVSIMLAVILYPFLKRGMKQLIWDFTVWILIPTMLIIKKLIKKIKG